MQILRRLFLYKGLAYPLRQRYNAAKQNAKPSIPINCKNRFLSPVTRVFRKRFFDHIFDYRQAWSTRKQWK